MSIIIDAYTMSMSLDLVATVGKGNFKKPHQDCFHHLLTGLLLWDTLEYPNSQYIVDEFEKLEGDSLTKQLRSLVTPLDSSIYSPFGSDMAKVSYSKLRASRDFANLDLEWLVKRSELYLDLSSRYDLCYFPHPMRSDYLASNELNTQGREALIRRLEKILTIIQQAI